MEKEGGGGLVYGTEERILRNFDLAFSPTTASTLSRL